MLDNEGKLDPYNLSTPDLLAVIFTGSLLLFIFMGLGHILFELWLHTWPVVFVGHLLAGL